jgi:hypothetical protein
MTPTVRWTRALLASLMLWATPASGVAARQSDVVVSVASIGRAAALSQTAAQLASRTRSKRSPRLAASRSPERHKSTRKQVAQLRTRPLRATTGRDICLRNRVLLC